MNPDGTFYICDACRQPVEADCPGVVRAYRLIHTPDLSGGDEVIDGMGVFFHGHHYPTSSRRFRRASVGDAS